MAAINLYIHDRQTVDPDGLCPKCSLPTLKLYVLERIDLDGITPIGERVACRDENIWVTELKEYAK